MQKTNREGRWQKGQEQVPWQKEKEVSVAGAETWLGFKEERAPGAWRVLAGVLRGEEGRGERGAGAPSEGGTASSPPLLIYYIFHHPTSCYATSTVTIVFDDSCH